MGSNKQAGCADRHKPLKSDRVLASLLAEEDPNVVDSNNAASI
jgi:hypothetical protein